MGKRSKEKPGKKERRRAEAAALAKSTWLSQTTELPDDRPAPWSTMPPSVPGASGAAGPSQARGASRASGENADPSPAASPHLADPAHASRSPVEPSELAARLAGLSTVLQRGLARADAGEGLTRARLSALSLLVLGGARSLGDLAAAERVRPPTMTRLVHGMERDGLVVREPHPTDRRSILIRATADGERLLEQGRSRQLASLAAAISELEAAERDRLDEAADLLGRLLRRAGRDRAERMA